MYAFQGPDADLRMGALLVYAVPTWAPWALATPLIIALGRRFPLEGDGWWRHLPVHLGAAALALAAHLAFFAFWTLQTSPYAPDVPWSEYTVRLLGSTWVFVDLFVYGVIFGGHQAVRFAQRARDRAVQASRLEAQLQQARFKALKMQLHPHFLFNTINAISTLVLKGATAPATQMLDRLSTFLRMALEERDAQTVPLARELAFANTYLSIERVRFSDRLSVTVDVDEGVRSTPVPHLILQPLVENAVRHGIAPKETAGHVRIAATAVGDRLRLVVEDDGPGLSAEKDSAADGPGEASDTGGLGLAMTRDRLQAAYGDAHTFTIESRDGGGVRVIVEVPLEPAIHNGPAPPAEEPSPEEPSPERTAPTAVDA
jgi:signal transduction histidine kinase